MIGCLDLREHLKQPITEEIALEFLYKNRYNIDYFLDEVPKELITKEFCLKAVKQSYEAIHWIPFVDDEIYKAAIDQFVNCFYWIKEPSKNVINHFYKAKIKEDCTYFKYIKNPPQEVIDLYNLLSI
jgi:hypothetical protein